MTAPYPPGSPAPLQAICRQVARLPRAVSNLESCAASWHALLLDAAGRIPALQVEAEGGMVFLGALSPGCQACKAGTWDCLFLTHRCNLECAFCYSPQGLPADQVGSVFGATPQQIAANHARTHITGVSFSGGEPFLEPARLLEWVAWFRQHHPEQHTWVYTNGLLADAAILRQLGDLGLDEIRFNLAATGYDHPRVMANLAAASGAIAHLTVEIPAIPAHAAKLLACLPAWAAAGVEFLNLHELVYEPGTLSASMPGARRQLVLPDGHRTAYDPQSRPLVFQVMEKVSREKIPLAVNDCSLQSKLLQIRGRRRSLSPLTRQPYEKLVDDEVLVSLFIYKDETEYRWLHPDELPADAGRFPGWRVIRLRREVPLVLDAAARWLDWEES